MESGLRDYLIDFKYVTFENLFNGFDKSHRTLSLNAMGRSKS